MKDVDVDAEMEDPPQASDLRNPIDASSGALDLEATQSEAPPATTTTTTTGLQQQNRKDVSLREFLSKMDDYAPIVRAPPCLSSIRGADG